MNGDPATPSASAFARRREIIRRGLVRANTAAFIVLLVVIGLALGAIVTAYRAEGDANAARITAEKLWQTTPIQARASRFSGEFGWRQDALEAIATASRIRPSLALRNEAIAALALADLHDTGIGQPIPLATQGLVFDADLKRYAINDGNGHLRIRRTEDNHELCRLDCEPGPASALQFSVDGRFIAARFSSGQLRVWDLTSRKIVREKQLAKDTWTRGALDFSPDGGRVAVGDAEGFVYRFELLGDKEPAPLAAGASPHLLRFCPDGQTLAVSTQSEVQIWDLRTERLMHKLAHPHTVEAMCWSADGRILATGSTDHHIYLWRPGLKEPQILRGHKDVVSQLTFNRRGNMLASCSYDGTTRIWDPSSGWLLLSTQRGFAWQFSRDDQRLAYLQAGTRFGIWKVIPASGYRTISVAEGPENNIWTTDFSPDGRFLAVVAADGARLIDLTTDRQVAFAPLRGARSAYFHPTGDSLIASSAEGLTIWSLEYELPDKSGAPRLSHPRRIKLPKDAYVEHAVLSAQGRFSLVRVSFKDAVLVDLENPERMVLFEDYPNLGLLALSPDGKWVATGTFHGKGTRIWDAHTGRPVYDLGGGNAGVGFSPDGRWLVNGEPDGYHFCEVASWKRGRHLPRYSAGKLPGNPVFSKDGSLLAIGRTLSLVALMQPDTGEEIASFQAPDSRIVTWVSLSSDNQQMALGTTEGIVQLWDLTLLRSHLAGLGLDWGLAAGRPILSGYGAGEASPFSNARLSASRFMAICIGGVGMAILVAMIALRRHRQLLEGYSDIDAMVTRRNEELRHARTELFHSQKMKALGTLAAGIAHDFNNLLSIIRMANKLTGHESVENREVQENVRLVEKAVGQGKQVVNSMLGYGRESTDAEGWYSVVELVESGCGLFSKQFLSGIDLVIELDRSAPAVYGCAGRLEQILLNLVVNASEALRQGGCLRIGVRCGAGPSRPFILAPRAAPRYVQLIVADSGPGIPPEIVNRIFEPFFTTKKSSASRGTGLGLSMVYTLAELDGLGVSLETGPGQGTEFLIAIPAG